MAKCLCSQNFKFLVINFLVVLLGKANKCAKKTPKTMTTSVLAKTSILVLIFSAFQIYLLIWTLYVRVLNLISTKWLNVCDLKTLNFRLLSFLLFYIKKRINVQKNENERACEALRKVPLLLPSSFWLLELQKLEKHMGINVRLFQRAVCFSLNDIPQNTCT